MSLCRLKDDIKIVFKGVIEVIDEVIKHPLICKMCPKAVTSKNKILMAEDRQFGFGGGAGGGKHHGRLGGFDFLGSLLEVIWIVGLLCHSHLDHFFKADHEGVFLVVMTHTP